MKNPSQPLSHIEIPKLIDVPRFGSGDGRLGGLGAPAADEDRAVVGAPAADENRAVVGAPAADENRAVVAAPAVEDNRSRWPASGIELAANLRSLADYRVALLAIMIASTVLRSWQLGAVGYNSDEAVYVGQAASLAGNAELQEFFPIFRAHPLLIQAALSGLFRVGLDVELARLVAAGIGIATVLLTYETGRLLYGRTAGLVAAAVMAVMPYHVIATRQFLLDGPMVLFSLLSLYSLARYARNGNVTWLYLAGGSLGFTFLSKEVGILFIGAAFTFFALTPSVPIRIRNLLQATAVMGIVVAPFPISLLLTGREDTGGSYLMWQLFRRPNHDWDFYLVTVPEVIGPVVIMFAVIGLLLLRRRNGWKESLLLSWIVVPIVFFQLWPVKGFQYLLPMAPPVALLAGRAVTRLAPIAARRVTRRTAIRIPPPAIKALLVLVLVLPLSIVSLQRIEPPEGQTLLAGSGGVPGGREAGEWLEENAPEGAELMTVGPSMANILQFYGHRKAHGISVSPNPLNRNPAYEPIVNPDSSIRQNDLQYVVWDSFSASRSSFFGDKILSYADRYNGRAVYTVTTTVQTPSGESVEQPIIIIYEVRP